jgi:hypothetical protein
MNISYQVLALIILNLLLIAGAVYIVNYYANDIALQNSLAGKDYQLSSINQELATAKQQATAAKEQSLKVDTTDTAALEKAENRYDIMRITASKLINSPEICATPPEKRSCENYNIQSLAGERYICPMNYTIINGYAPGGLTGPVCHMNNGAEGTPKTCKDSSDPRCDPQLNMIACLGPWPCSKYACNNYYGQWYVIKAIPAKEVCGK